MKLTAEAISHEVGHSLGLGHDGTSDEEYYRGHGSGNTGWAPIMGVGYTKSLTQWSHGEYPDADNAEDDLSIITGSNGFDYRQDDHGDSRADASSLTNGIYNWGAVKTEGVIETNTDQDYFQLITAGGPIDLRFKPAERGPNLDILAALWTDDGELVAVDNPTRSLEAQLNVTLPAGTYFVSVEGVGENTLATGYSDYGSLGYYSIFGSVPPVRTSNDPSLVLYASAPRHGGVQARAEDAGGGDHVATFGTNNSASRVASTADYGKNIVAAPAARPKGRPIPPVRPLRTRHGESLPLTVLATMDDQAENDLA